MHYHSTRGPAGLPFSNILLEGLAPDGGLYVPEYYPHLHPSVLESLRGASYVTVAHTILSLFADIPSAELALMLKETYTPERFGEGITPLRWFRPGVALLRLSNGPTLAFKDVPLQLLGRLMSYTLSFTNGELNILGATSGDTGSAAEYAFAGKSGLRVFMLSPYGRMSEFQQRQMYTLDVPNIHNLAVNGTFDDCQAVVKAVNADADFKLRYAIGAVNSINWARIAAQVVYYVYAYCQATTKPGQRVSFCVPSGNFGNALAAYVAGRMGLPIGRIIIATNENDVLDQFFKTGVYRVRQGSEVKVTSSPSMDIASASNFERYMFDWVGGDESVLARLWGKLKTDGEFSVASTDFAHQPGDVPLVSGSATDQEVLDTIRSVYVDSGLIIDPHTAVGVKVGLENVSSANYPLIVAETAQPAKFADTIAAALGTPAPVPEAYRKLGELPQKVTRIDPDPEVVKQYIREHVS